MQPLTESTNQVEDECIQGEPDAKRGGMDSTNGIPSGNGDCQGGGAK